MGISDTGLILDLIQRVRYWISWVGRNSIFSYSMCCECKTMDFNECQCESCGHVLCGKCAEEHVKLCKFCVQGDVRGDYGVRIAASLPRISPESQLVLNDDNIKQFQSHHLSRFLEVQRYGCSSSSSVTSSTGHPSPGYFRHSSSRSDEEDGEDSGKHFFSPSSEYCRDISDVDSSSISARHDFYSFKSMSSSPLDSPSRSQTPTRVDFSVQQDQEGSPASHNDLPHQETMAVLRRPGRETEDLETTGYGCDDLSIFRDQCEEVQQPLDFENNGLIWFPPPPEDEGDEMENNFFESDDEDGDVGELGMTFSSNSFSTNAVPYRDKPSDEHKEPLRAAVRGHFRALVSQLLQGEGVSAGNESGTEGWLDIVTSVAWQAANFVKPDTRRGGSMDPGHYVKVKCIVSGTPSESTLIKGVVCTKNIKHKRMTSQYKNPRLLILGGALEYQRTPNQLASFDTLLQQEMDHLKMVVAKIEAHRPNVLLVEKSVASYAQEYLLAKEISLVLNVKRPLLERIARCTGANIVPSIGNLSMTRLGHCEIFRLERVFEDQPNKRSAKTLMFFEGCPRRLGCTVLLKGASREVLKKVKHVVQYAVFAAYHLSLETCFLADEGASLPEIPLKPTVSIPKRHINTDDTVPQIPNAVLPSDFLPVAVQCQDSCQCTTSRNSCFHLTSDVSVSNDDAASSVIPSFRRESSPWDLDPGYATATSGFSETAVGRAIDASSGLEVQRKNFSACPSEHELLEASLKEDKTRESRNHGEIAEDHTVSTSDRIGGNEVSTELFSSVENHQSILVSFSSRCVLKGTICERSQLLRIKFYGCFDKPLGRYLQEDLFNQTSHCLSCKEATDAHVRCYTHQQGSLTINVRRLSSVELPGERDGKMWMWHRCLKCAHINGVPPATRRVIMSDAAWGLSFGKFLELSFSNHATANRVANCGHSLQRDCLRYYGFGGMVAFFRYSPIDILSVRLPPSMLQFNGHFQQEWVNREATEVSNKMEVLYAEVGDALHNIERKGSSLKAKQSDESEFHSHVMDLKILLKTERNEYENLLRPVAIENSHYLETTVDILELNRLRRCLLIDSYIWDHRLYSLDSLLKTNSLISKVDSRILEAATYTKLKEWRDNSLYEDGKLGHASGKSKMNSCGVSENTKDHLTSKEIGPNSPHFVAVLNELPAIHSADRACFRDMESTSIHAFKCDELSQNEEIPVDDAFLESIPSPASNLSDKIDSAWTGTCQQPLVSQVNHVTQPNGYKTTPFGLTNQKDNPVSSRLRSPMRVYSFDSALRMQEKIRRRSVPTYLQLSSLRSFPSGDYRSMVRDPISDTTLKSFSVTMLKETQKLNSIFSSMPLFIPSASHIGEGIQLPLSQTNFSSMVIPIYDNEPTSIIAYVLGSNEYHNWIAQKFEDHEGGWSGSDSNREDGVSVVSNYYHSASSTFSAWQSHGSLDLEDGIFRHGSEDASATGGGLFSDPKTSHFRVSFGDASSSFAGKVKFSVVCYFARQFDALRQKCCPSEVNFISSLSRCSRWNAQGGKSNVYFARSFDERFIVKQVTKTELDSFEEFAPEYFKYLTDSLSTGSPTCLAKVLGIYQVTVKHLKGGRESRMDLMVMENLFFGRGISRVYDLKGSARSRYNPDTTGKNKVLLDTNLLETLRTNPIFLSGKAKRSLERAVWNDTSFLAFVDVMDYSLLVGVDEERKELVLGIIDFMRQYTWDKHLETWVKASGILGGPKNASPTVISPVQYKKRFRKAMSTYFLTVPDQWSQ